MATNPPSVVSIAFRRGLFRVRCEKNREWGMPSRLNCLSARTLSSPGCEGETHPWYHSCLNCLSARTLSSRKRYGRQRHLPVPVSIAFRRGLFRVVYLNCASWAHSAVSIAFRRGLFRVILPYWWEGGENFESQLPFGADSFESRHSLFGSGKDSFGVSIAFRRGLFRVSIGNVWKLTDYMGLNCLSARTLSSRLFWDNEQEKKRISLNCLSARTLSSPVPPRWTRRKET